MEKRLRAMRRRGKLKLPAGLGSDAARRSASESTVVEVVR
jgi:hypothetical protein